MTMAVAVLSAAAGAVLGLLGGGGSTLTVPIMLYVAKLDPHTAIAASLPVVGITMQAGAGFAGQLSHATIAVPLAVLASGAALAGAFGGAYASRMVSQSSTRKRSPVCCSRPRS